MCKVKTGEDVHNLQDVQNLVTGIIFRQICSFKRGELLRAVDHYMTGSPIRNDYKVESIVDTTLMTCISNDWLLYRRGSFLPQRTGTLPLSTS
jgi:hypothetical protein